MVFIQNDFIYMAICVVFFLIFTMGGLIHLLCIFLFYLI